MDKVVNVLEDPKGDLIVGIIFHPVVLRLWIKALWKIIFLGIKNRRKVIMGLKSKGGERYWPAK